MVLAEINALPNDYKYLNVLTRIESRLALRKIKLSLHKFSASQKFLSINEINQFAELLSERWYYIKNTDSCYPHQPQTSANLACFKLARYLTELSGQEVYMLLMPTVCANNPVTSRQNLSFFRMHEFVFADDGTPIEVAKCLDHAAANKTLTLFHTDGSGRLLNKKESSRIIHHSVEANDYYETIKYYLQTGHSYDLAMASKTLHQTLESETCAVTATYGTEGKKRQAKAILSYIKDANDFLDVLTETPRDEWRELIKEIDIHDLRKLLLGDNSWISMLGKKSMFSTDDIRNRAFLFCMAEIYKSLLNEESKNRWSYFAAMGQKYLGEYSKYIQSYSKKELLAAIEVLQDFLLLNKNLNELESYLKNDPEKAVQIGPLFELGSDLRSITAQMELISSPEFFQIRPPPRITGWISSRFLRA